MKNFVTGIALAALLGAAPAVAKDKASSMKGEGGQQSASAEENANRLQNDDGTFQGKPVVQGPANWQSAYPSSTGASSGESGSAAGSERAPQR